MKIMLKIFGVMIAAGMLIGCGKPSEQPAESPAPAAQPDKPQPSGMPPLPPSTTKTPTVTPPSAVPAVGNQGAGEISQIEAAYLANPDFAKRVELIYKISDVGTVESIAALSRLFNQEKDPDLKIEVVDSLFDIDGLDQHKVALLVTASAANQPKEVRESAIDALGDLEPKYALPILQSLAADPDEDIREAAKDQIELLQAEQAMQK
jgi:HEAT repeat protein